MEDEQLERFREAVDRKSEQAKAASEQTKHQTPYSPAPDVGGSQQDLTSAGRTQDTYDARAKNSRKGKVTADKWGT